VTTVHLENGRITIEDSAIDSHRIDGVLAAVRLLGRMPGLTTHRARRIYP